MAVTVSDDFECPPEFPYRLDIENGVVCSAEPIKVDDLPEEVCSALGVCSGDVDGGPAPDGAVEVVYDGGPAPDAVIKPSGDAQVVTDTCNFEEVTFSSTNLTEAGSGCPIFPLEGYHRGEARLYAASVSANELGHVLDIDINYCPNSDNDCSCRLSFAGGFSHQMALSQANAHLQTMIGETLQADVKATDGSGSWSVQLLSANTKRENLVFAAARFVDTKPNVQGPGVTGGPISLIWGDTKKVCASGDGGYSVAEEGSIVFPNSVLGTVKLGEYADVVGEETDRFRVHFTEGRQVSMTYTTSAFFLPLP